MLSPQEAVQMALKEQGREARIGILKCGDMLQRITSLLKIMKKAGV
jgi:hypothetical protein